MKVLKNMSICRIRIDRVCLLLIVSVLRARFLILDFRSRVFGSGEFCSSVFSCVRGCLKVLKTEAFHGPRFVCLETLRQTAISAVHL